MDENLKENIAAPVQLPEWEEVSAEKFEIIGSDFSEAEKIARPHITYLSDSWRRFKQNKTALISLVILAIIGIMCIIGPMISPHDYVTIHDDAANLKPCAEWWFGTDKLGRDLFARVWMGGRVSMTIGLVASLLCSVIGCVYGGVAAYFGGKVDSIMMRIVEILLSIPYLLIVILLSIVLQSHSVGTLLIAMCVMGWCSTARLVRGEMLRIKEEEYIMAAQSLGVSPFKTIIKHMIPNTLNTVIVSLTFAIPNFIFSEAFLSYVGLGVQAPETSWGALCNAAQQRFLFYPYQLFFPGLMIALTMLCFTLLGDGLRDALDPKLRK